MPYALEAKSLITATWGIPNSWDSSRWSTIQVRFMVAQRPSATGPATAKQAA